MTLDEFLEQLTCLCSHAELLEFCRKHILHGTPYVFRNKEPEFYEFRKRVADKFAVEYQAVSITGSAHLGFSPFYKTPFTYDSDVDVAIVSARLFDEMMEPVRQYQMQLRTARRTVTADELRMYHEFLEYTAIGWIRPDKLPVSFRVRELKDDWFDFFRSVSNGTSEVGDYKVAGGVFKTPRHLELYTISGIERVKQALGGYVNDTAN